MRRHEPIGGFAWQCRAPRLNPQQCNLWHRMGLNSVMAASCLGHNRQGLQCWVLPMLSSTWPGCQTRENRHPHKQWSHLCKYKILLLLEVTKQSTKRFVKLKELASVHLVMCLLLTKTCGKVHIATTSRHCMISCWPTSFSTNLSWYIDSCTTLFVNSSQNHIHERGKDLHRKLSSTLYSILFTCVAFIHYILDYPSLACLPSPLQRKQRIIWILHDLGAQPALVLIL